MNKEIKCLFLNPASRHGHGCAASGPWVYLIKRKKQNLEKCDSRDIYSFMCVEHWRHQLITALSSGRKLIM